MLLLASATACLCCSSVLSLIWFVAVGTFGPLLALTSSQSFSRLLAGGSFGSTAVCSVAVEGARAVASAAAAMLLLRVALWLLLKLLKRRGSPEEGTQADPPLLKAACLAEGSSSSLLISAIPPDATGKHGVHGRSPWEFMGPWEVCKNSQKAWCCSN